MLPRRAGELLLALSPRLFAPGHCGRAQTDAAGLGEDAPVVVVGEGGGGAGKVGAAVGVEDVAVEEGPLELVGGRGVSLVKNV